MIDPEDETPTDVVPFERLTNMDMPEPDHVLGGEEKLTTDDSVSTGTWQRKPVEDVTL